MSDSDKQRAAEMVSSPGRPMTFDLSRDCFPLLIQLHCEESGELLWERMVYGPCAIKTPGFAPRKVESTVHFLRTGQIFETGSDGVTRQEQA